MPVKTLSWFLLAALALGAVLLFLYWASFQLLSLLVYIGIVAGLLGLANLAFPFRFMGVRKRAVGARVLAGGVILALVALYWPASTISVAQHRTLLDDILPAYQFSERHAIGVHARPEQVLQAVRESTWGDLTSLAALLKVRAVASRTDPHSSDAFVRDSRILDGFAASGYVSGGNDHEILMAGGPDLRARRPIPVHTLKQFADYREAGAIKMVFDFYVQELGNGRCKVTAETRVLALDDSGRGMARYWRLIVPGSGLLRREWLAGIKRRAEHGS